jgi:hypothetical protein
MQKLKAVSLELDLQALRFEQAAEVLRIMAKATAKKPLVNGYKWTIRSAS